MDKTKTSKIRGLSRSSFTRCFNSLVELLNLELIDIPTIEAMFNVLRSHWEKIIKMDQEMIEFLLNEDANVEDLENESRSADEYRTKYETIKVKVQWLKEKESNNERDLEEQYSSVSNNSNKVNLRKVKLPKIELTKFNGDIKQWIPFWSQFKKIDEDESLAAVDKFHYLLQSTVPGTNPREIIQSFPPSAENYSKAVDTLKSRYGNDNLLIEVYIRDLLSLILQNNMSKPMSLASLYDRLETHLRSLETLGVTTGKCAAILCPLIESCMPEEFLRNWQRHSSTKEGDEESEMKKDDVEKRLNRLMKFMETEIHNEIRISLAKSGFGLTGANAVNKTAKRKEKKPNEEVPYTAMGLLTTQQGKAIKSCIFCNKSNHKSMNCFKARNMDLESKRKIIINKGCCFLCLKPNHRENTCNFKPKCYICEEKHVIVLCPDLLKRKENSVLDSVQEKADPPGAALANFTSTDTTVLLPTINILIKGDGCQKEIRAVIDSGSQKSYIKKSTAKEMKYQPIGERIMSHTLFGGQKTGESSHNLYKIYLTSLSKNYSCNFDALEQSNICGNLPGLKSGPWLEELKDIDVTISDFNKDDNPIEVLIGADIAGKLYTGNIKQLSCGLVAIETKLGWTIMGKMPGKSIKTSESMMVTSLLINEFSVADMWKLDVIGISDPSQTKSRIEIHNEVQKYFLDTVKLQSDGRYQVNLPWLECHPPLPNNFDVACKRLTSTINKLKSDNLFDDYENVLDDWILEGVIEKVPPTEIDTGKYYLPHRAVVKENRTTRVRPVFDASSHAKNKPSLNDCLDKGLNLIELMPSLIVRFRLKKFGVVADIKKAFLQISLHPSDRDFLRFLWRGNNNELIIYRHKRVVFGVVSSPFLLGAVIQLHLSNILEGIGLGRLTYSENTINTLLESFYVDNCITSKDDKQELDNFIHEATSVMSVAKFELRGWEFTDQNLIENQVTNVLGFNWSRKYDTLGINLDCLNKFEGKVTKRIILSYAHRVFDVIGFTCPTTLVPKILLRSIWETKIGWDEDVNEDVGRKFLHWLDELHYLKEINVPRWLPGSEFGEWTLHTFCDASESAYAAVVFLRVENETGVNLQMVQAKARVAPSKRVTIPRLELLAALIGARLHASLFKDFPDVCMSWFWSDSTTVLAWISRENHWATFVENRVREIRTLTKVEQWNFVPGTHNPADLPSRGCLGKRLLRSTWWEGPEWLRGPPEFWPTPKLTYDEEAIGQERRKTIVSSLMYTENILPTDWYYKYISKFDKMVGMIAWIYRFIHNTRAANCSEDMRRRGPLTYEEKMVAEIRLLKYVQKDSFKGVSDNNIACLQPFEDHEGVIRLRTKIAYRQDSKDFRFPILLPKEHPVVTCLIRKIHEKNCHVGVHGLLALVRERFWIMGGRRTIRSVISKCVTCRRNESKPLVTPTLPLPNERVRDAGTFEIIGIDLAGPIFLKEKRKAWICLFTCATVRAVHLELVLSLSTEDFLLAFRRFVSRRGRPAVVFCDNGTNFTGAAKAFCKLDWNKVQDYSNVQRINWKFSPPTGSWWGGWWERLIGMTKRLLRKVLGRSILDYTEMETVLCECEFVLNSRPLTFMSDDLPEPIALTPAMFIQDIKTLGLPECDVIETSNLTKKFKVRAKLKMDFRRRFRSEYLGQLRQKSKLLKPANIHIGDLVLIGNDRDKRLEWPLGKIVDLLPGKDGNIRLVRLEISPGESLLRPVQRIYPLVEVEENLQSLKKLTAKSR